MGGELGGEIIMAVIVLIVVIGLSIYVVLLDKQHRSNKSTKGEEDEKRSSDR